MFDILLDKVSEVCEVRKDCIVQGNKMQSVVDARMLAIQYLRRIGLSSDDIALIVLRLNCGDSEFCPPQPDLKRKAKSIDRAFNMYSSRCMESCAFCLMSTEIAEFCRDTFNTERKDWNKVLSSK